jgi:hypothetical protein
MSVVNVNRTPSRRQLNQFGFIWLGFLVLFGVLAWFKFHAPPVAVGLWVAAIVVPAVGWLVPVVMRWVFVGMSYAAWPIGFVVSHLVLAVVYYLVLTPIGVIMRLFGYDPMTRRRSTRDGSRWVKRATDRGPESYFRQF